MKKMKKRLEFIYSNQNIENILTSMKERITETKTKSLKRRKQDWDQEDVVLITYGDQFYEKNIPTLKSFKNIFDSYLEDKFEIVHLLPFYPYSSDDGFSVIDYKKVNPILGDWKEIEKLSHSTRIMFDDVCNHISAKSDWFQEYLKGNPKYENFFTEMDPNVDLSAVTRPRATPVLTKFTLENGEEKYIWTTFSEDQIDLNFSNPQVLLKMVDVLLFYIEQGAEYIRLDAIGFMWKEIGTTCIHHEKTHEIVKLFRDVVDEVAKGTVIITETNVPHKDNVSYFGNGNDEAHMVYQFPLPPLVLYSIHNGNGSALSDWARQLPPTSSDTTFFNFLASHDGIGVNPIRGIIPEEEILLMIEDLKEEGALVSYKKNSDGSESPYEINVTYLDALNKKADDDLIRVKRFLVAHSILLTLPGVPAVYIQSILGSRNDYEGVSKTGMNRSINRQKYDMNEIENELTNTDTLRNMVFTELTDIIQKRKNEALFHPNVKMEVLDLGEKVFAFKRVNEQKENLWVIHNLTNAMVNCDLTGNFVNIITGEKVELDNSVSLKPYEFLWLKAVNGED
ncbi:alpha-amylase family glycosyl hydrolase [Priestia filamentosa]|uniref:Sucrose phosphorylase n=1 Tax=Priestia filamentosa TaxID=1402861 RepID=A0A1X7EM91_9BACI|nr:alpha-amylase family glycosyl hydrolase [Priestia filamentosa]AKO93168.1 sugar phosphorylase [Priestia filamentosa]MDT3763304.1 alpha-amylase family glycosyl hydrolase [Priestia filamentosa]OXS69807.1 sugar phosphorylase [Priestia filamentosa]WRU93768.1 alpha-amylase family glycosyl hydrolase [Priestia filamentosa]SMF36429.1 sucrose phosphorylase [Priestia filamentosa]